MPKTREYESFGKQFLRIWSEDFEATWLLLSIPITSTVIALLIWFVNSMMNKRKKKTDAEAPKENNIDRNENTTNVKDERLIENVIDQLAVSQFIAHPAVAFSEARRSITVLQ